jgi:ankyrin repeat protein
LEAVTFNPNPEVITALAKAGADVNTRNVSGDTALMEANYPAQASKS